MEWTDCPQCGEVAEVVDRDVWPSTDGPVEHVHVRCADRHRFVLPAASLERHHAQLGIDVGATAGHGLEHHPSLGLNRR
jgi:hypothetical protein